MGIWQFGKVFVLAYFFLAVNFAYAQVQIVTTMQGRLLKADNRPLAYTEIELVPVSSEKIVNDSRLIGVSDTRGFFTFSNVPDGRYTLSINFDDKPTDLSPFATYFYPGTEDRSAAEVFDIDASTRIRGLTFKLARALTGMKITGVVTWNDGVPVKGALVGCRDLGYDRVISFGCARTDANGRFSISGFTGRRYQIGALAFEKPVDDQQMQPGYVVAAGETEVFDLERSTPPLTIKVLRSREVQKLIDKYIG
jgi:hypothetical protein